MEKKKAREIPYYYQKYFDILCDNGLENVFFFTEKASLLKIIITLTIGIASMGLAIGLGIRTINAFPYISKVLKGLGISESILGATLGLSFYFQWVR